MADITDAYGSPFYNSCSLKFDIAPLFVERENESFCGGKGSPHIQTEWIGVVTIKPTNGSLQSYTYEVFATDDNDNTYSSAPRSTITKGNIVNSNNLSFTFPITNVNLDYFVLVTPTYKPANNDVTCVTNQRTRSKDIMQPPTRSVSPWMNGTQMQPDHTMMGFADAESRNKQQVLGSVSTTQQSDQKFAIFYTSKIIKLRNENARKYKSQRAPCVQKNLIVQKNLSHETPNEVSAMNDICCTTASAGTNGITTDAINPSNMTFEVPKFVGEYQPKEEFDLFVSEHVKPQNELEFEAKLKSTTKIVGKHQSPKEIIDDEWQLCTEWLDYQPIEQSDLQRKKLL